LREFLIQHGVDGTFLTGKVIGALWSPFASDGQKFEMDAAFRMADRVPRVRIVEVAYAGTYTQEELRASDQFCHLADRI